MEEILVRFGDGNPQPPLPAPAVGNSHGEKLAATGTIPAI